MGFYQEIAKYYDDIFIPKPNQVHFIKNEAGLPPKRLLDIACGTGSYALKLADMGYQVTGIDLDKEMITQAKEKLHKNEKVDFHIENMLTYTPDKQFDLIYCIGNSLVHLNTINDIKLFFSHMKKQLKPKGKIIIQIINYDRILNQEINHLPTITNEEKKLQFIRKYRYVKDEHKIIFETRLMVSNQEVTNSIKLLPLLSYEVKEILESLDFKDICFYGDFNYTPYDRNNAYALVVSASIL